MAAKKSDPDAKRMGVVPIGHAVNFTGKKDNGQEKITFVGDAVNKSGGKKSGGNMKSIDGLHDVKTEVAIPSVKNMMSKVSKQMKENDKINNKYRGDD